MTVDLSGLNLLYVITLMSGLGIDLTKMFDKAVFVVGGGKRARQAFQDDGVKAAIAVTQEHASQLGAVLYDSLRLPLLREVPKSVIELEQAISGKAFGVAVGGLQAGQTTDAVAMSALNILSNQGYQVYPVVLSNVPAIYTADPQKDDQARAIKSASLIWLVEQGVLTAATNEFVDGMSVPLDPVAVNRFMSLQQHSLLFTSAEDVTGVRQFLTDEEVQSGTLIAQGVETCLYPLLK
jgi:uridylate kinase